MRNRSRARPGGLAGRPTLATPGAAQPPAVARSFPRAMLLMEGMTRILITRHGQAEHNLNTRFFMGRAPGARLTPLGREQARRLAARLVREGAPGRIICSSLPRTVETAEEISRGIGPLRIEREDAFWELSKGAWEGHMPRTLPPEVQREVDGDPFGYRYPGGESYREVWQRIAPAFDGWVARFPGETILFVLHGDVIRALLYHVIRFPPERIGDWATDPCALFELTREPGGHTVIIRLNDSAHLTWPDSPPLQLGLV